MFQPMYQQKNPQSNWGFFISEIIQRYLILFLLLSVHHMPMSCGVPLVQRE